MGTKVRKTNSGVEICWNYSERGPNVWETYYSTAVVDKMVAAAPESKSLFDQIFGKDIFSRSSLRFPKARD